MPLNKETNQTNECKYENILRKRVLDAIYIYIYIYIYICVFINVGNFDMDYCNCNFCLFSIRSIMKPDVVLHAIIF